MRRQRVTRQVARLERLLSKCTLRSKDLPAAAGAAVSDRRTTGGDAVVRIGLLLPLTGMPAGKYVAGAATLAIADINADPSLMQGRQLEYTYSDSGCSSITGVTAIQELLGAPEPVHGVIGAACSSAEFKHELIA